MTEPGKEVVGPLPTVSFRGGRATFHEPYAVQAYTVPKNTLDPRYQACTDHHVACDCREAELAEEISELRSEYKTLKAAVQKHIAGHRTWSDDTYVRVSDRWYGDEPVWRYELDDRPCTCPGCRIARDGGIFPKL